jgi:hypothetical protein
MSETTKKMKKLNKNETGSPRHDGSRAASARVWAAELCPPRLAAVCYQKKVVVRNNNKERKNEF